MARRAFIAALATAFGLASLLVAPLNGRADAAEPFTTIFLPNVVKMLGGDDGWNTPFIVQNVGNGPTDVLFEFYSFADGSLVKTRTVPALQRGTSAFHSPNHDPDLSAGGQYSVVIKSFDSPIVAVVNEHQSESNPQRQEALSYDGLTTGSTKVYLPLVAAVANGWYCTVITQNLGVATANVIADFKSFDGVKTAQITRTIPARGSKFIDPRFETSLVAGTEYAVTLTSTQPIGAVVNCHNDDASVGAPRAFSYGGSPASNEITTFAPYTVKTLSNRMSRIIVQNAGSTPAQPVVTFLLLGAGPSAGPGLHIVDTVNGPAGLQPGAVWSYDLATSPLLGGERSLSVKGGQFALLVETLAPTNAMAYTGATEWSSRVYLPNITRTLGGTTGWTTPIVVQAQHGYVATLSWYRFADGALVHTQRLDFGLEEGRAFKVDPRDIPQLSDDTQYGVVIEASAGGVGAVVLELNDRGGDSAMSYEGMTPAPFAGFGTSSCTPRIVVSGGSVRCRFYGLPPGTASVTYSLTGETPTTITEEPVAPDGSWAITYTGVTTVGLLTASATAGGITKSASFSVTTRTFGVQLTQYQGGSIVATTKPGAACIASTTVPENGFPQPVPQYAVKTADASGTVSWTYPPTWSGIKVVVRCTVGDETHRASSP
jgi:hypothetical protein